MEQTFSYLTEAEIIVFPLRPRLQSLLIGDFVYIKMEFEDQKREFNEKPQMASGLVYDGTAKNLLKTNDIKAKQEALYKNDMQMWLMNPILYSVTTNNRKLSAEPTTSII